MSLLGDFLEAFYAPNHSFRTVFARVHHERPSGEATTSRRMVIGKRKPSSKKLNMVTSEMSFWVELPDRARVEVTQSKGSESKTTTEVVRGHEHFKRRPDGSVEVDSEPGPMSLARYRHPTEYARHFDRSLIREFFSSLTLQQVGECQIAGRDCVRILAQPLNEDHIWPHWLSLDADAYEFVADVAVPSLLSIHALNDGELIESHEVIEVRFDESIDEAMFTCEPIEGQQVHEAVPIAHQLSAKGAAARVPFKLLFPRKQSGTETQLEEVMHAPARVGRDEHLTVSVRGNRECKLWYYLRARPEREMQRDLEWETVEISGRKLNISDPEVPEGLRVLSFEQAGTCVEIVSDLPRADLFDFALSMEVFSG